MTCYLAGLTQPQQQVPPNPVEALHNAVFNCNVYGDERDTTLARWNLLQALWGIGKGKHFFAKQMH
jgi:nuclear pore complex protein Nup54